VTLAGGLGLLDLSSCAFTEAEMNKAVVNKASENILFIANCLYRKVKYWRAHIEIKFLFDTYKVKFPVDRYCDSAIREK
jgi:hypothetical protein